MSAVDSEWVSLKDWKADSPIVQSLTAVHIWPTLTPKQRKLVAACRSLRDPEAEFPQKYAIDVDGIKADRRTMQSLESKGVVDEHGRLTVPGIYTALWNQLEKDQERGKK